MPLKEKWVDKVNNVDYIDANDINSVAHAVIEVEEKLEAVDLPGGGLSYTEKNLILSLFKNAAYTTNMSATIAQLETLWSETPETPENGVEQIGKVLSIVSGVTVNQIGSILTIA